MDRGRESSSHKRGVQTAILIVWSLLLLLSPRGSAAAAGVYMVRSGDSAWSIAERHQVQVKDLLAINNLSSRSTLKVGQTLRLPSRYTTTTYRLQRGDTISSVSKKFNVSPATLISENGIANPRRLREGYELRIPGAVSTVARTPASHTVTRGQNLTAIAGRYGVTVSELARANGIANSDRLKIGATLRIPGAGGSEATASTSRRVSTTPASHTVRRGEVLAAIAAKYGVTVAQLKSANALRDANRLEVGQTLSIPGAGSSAASVAQPSTHTVRRGEYLAGIARKYGVSQSQLKAWNGIPNANRLQVGQVLRVSGEGANPVGAAPGSSATAEVSHKVRRGEYLAVIAQKYGVTVKSLIDRNNIRDARRIIPGTVLTIPGVVSGSVPSSATRVASSASGGAAARKDVVHVVRRGEFLVAIAKRYGVTHQAIQTVNRLSDPRRISPGQRLVIPLSGNTTTPRPVAASVSPAAYTPSPSTSSTGSQYHRVQRGESLARVATRYGVSVADLQRANRISNRNLIVPGQVLRIPEPSSNRSRGGGWGWFGGGRQRGPELPSTVERRLEGTRVQRGVWKNIVLHHTATSSGSVSGLDRYHRLSKRMQNGLAYHFLIGNGNGMRDGEIHVGERWLRQIAGGHLVSNQLNANSIGICLVGNFENGKPSAKQMESVVALLNWLTSELSISKTRITTHTLIHPNHTLCPGKHFPLNEIRDQVR